MLIGCGRVLVIRCCARFAAAGAADKCYMIAAGGSQPTEEPQFTVLPGRTTGDGQIEWGKPEAQTLKQITYGQDDVLMGLTCDGALAFKNVGNTWEGFLDWTQLTSVSAYNPSKSLSWSFITQGAGELLGSKSTKFEVLANGQRLPRTQTKWGSLYNDLLLARNTRITDLVSEASAGVSVGSTDNWRLSEGEVKVGLKAIAFFPHDGTWYYGRCVGSRHFESAYCFLVRFSNAVYNDFDIVLARPSSLACTNAVSTVPHRVVDITLPGISC